MATKLDNDLAKHISNFGYNAVDSLYIHTNGFTATLDGSFTANQTITIPDMSGTLALTSDLTAYLPLAGGTLSGQLKFSASGNLNSPVIEFVDSKLGLYRHGSNHLRIGVSGTAVQGWQSTFIENLQQVRNIDGVAATPAISFTNYTDAGIYIDSKNTIAVSTVGIKRLSISDTNLISTLPITATIFRATSGTFPQCAFTNGTNDQTGLYFGTTTTCAIACNGVAKFTFGSSSNTSFQQITIPDGSYASPSLNFSSYSNTGLVAAGGASPTLYVVTNGSIRAQFNQNGNYFPVQIQGKDGAVNDPSFSWANEQSSGLYRKGTNDLRFSVQSADSLGIQQNGILLYGSTAGNNASYVATKLSYYEEFNENLTFNCGNRSVSKNVKFVRCGNSVTCQITSDIVILAPSTAQQFVTSTAFQTRFRPSNTIYFAWWVNDDATSQQRTWRGMISTGGIIEMYRENGVSTGGYTLFAFSMSWSIY